MGREIHTYLEWCIARRCSPSGRAIIAMKTFFFRVDREQGRYADVWDLFHLHVKSYSIDDIRDFQARVRGVISQLKQGDLVFVALHRSETEAATRALAARGLRLAPQVLSGEAEREGIDD